MISKKQINREREAEIARRLSDPKERIKLYVDMWFPMQRDRWRYNSDDEYYAAKLHQLEREAEQHEQERDKR